MDVKETIKICLDAISLLGHTSQDISSMRRQKLKSAFNARYASLCELDYTDCTNKFLFGDDLSKSLNKARDITNLKRSIQPDKKYQSSNNSYYSSNNSNANRRPSNSFLYKGNNNQHGPPKRGWGKRN